MTNYCHRQGELVRIWNLGILSLIIGHSSFRLRLSKIAGLLPFEEGFDAECKQGQQCQQARDREGRSGIIFVIKFFDSQRHRISRSEEHTSELQSRLHLVCRLLLEKKKSSNTH